MRRSAPADRRWPQSISSPRREVRPVVPPRSCRPSCPASVHGRVPSVRRWPCDDRGRRDRPTCVRPAPRPGRTALPESSAGVDRARTAYHGRLPPVRRHGPATARERKSSPDLAARVVRRWRGHGEGGPAERRGRRRRRTGRSRPGSRSHGGPGPQGGGGDQAVGQAAPAAAGEVEQLGGRATASIGGIEPARRSGRRRAAWRTLTARGRTAFGTRPRRPDGWRAAGGIEKP